MREGRVRPMNARTDEWSKVRDWGSRKTSKARACEIRQKVRPMSARADKRETLVCARSDKRHVSCGSCRSRDVRLRYEQVLASKNVSKEEAHWPDATSLARQYETRHWQRFKARARERRQKDPSSCAEQQIQKHSPWSSVKRGAKPDKHSKRTS